LPEFPWFSKKFGGREAIAPSPYFVRLWLIFLLLFFSCATIPITLSCFEKKKVVDRRLAEFLLPIATVTNISGTAIYIAVSSIFLVQTFHPNMLTFTSSVVIW
jgi:Na+/H+-dicarboxylate symporter